MNLSSASLEIQLPEEVEIRLNQDSTIDLLVPAVFYNTGAPRGQRIVTSITATLKDNRKQGINLYWIDTHDFIGKTEFESKYPEKVSPDVDDYILYKSRSIPFVVPGGGSDSKMLRLVPAELTNTGGEFSTFELELVVKTSDENFKVKEIYSGNSGLSLDKYMWFKKSPR